MAVLRPMESRDDERRCYFCYDRLAVKFFHDFPTCDRCNTSIIEPVKVKPEPIMVTLKIKEANYVEPEPPALKVSDDVREVAGHTLHLVAWRAGGCVLCGGEDRQGLALAHAACWEALPRDHEIAISEDHFIHNKEWRGKP